jgi:hypothetical protein
LTGPTKLTRLKEIEKMKSSVRESWERFENALAGTESEKSLGLNSAKRPQSAAVGKTSGKLNKNKSAGSIGAKKIMRN